MFRPTTPGLLSCAACEKVGTLRCTGCKKVDRHVTYCGVECQRVLWPTHKHTCGQVPNRGTPFLGAPISKLELLSVGLNWISEDLLIPNGDDSRFARKIRLGFVPRKDGQPETIEGLTERQKADIDDEHELVARPIFRTPIAQVADYRWFRRAAFELLLDPPKNVIRVARPGPSVYPYIAAQAALKWIPTADNALFLDPEFQHFVDAIIVFFTVLDAWACGRSPIPETSAQMDALIERIVTAASGLERRASDIVTPGVGTVNAVNMCTSILIMTFMRADGRKHPVFEGSHEGASMGRDLIYRYAK